MANTEQEMDLDIIEVPIENPVTDPELLAEAQKNLGNEQYKLKRYREAIPFYSVAVDLRPNNPSYYGNRSACYMMMGDYTRAISDARQSITIDPKFVKGFTRIAKCSLALGDINAAENALSRAMELEPNNATLKPDLQIVQSIKHYLEEARKAEEKKDYRKVVYCMDRVIEHASACQRFRVLKAECLAHLGRHQEAQELANEILGRDKNCAEAVLVRGFCLYYQGELDLAIQHFQHALRLAPDNSKAREAFKKAKSYKQKREEGIELVRTGKNDEAYKLYTEALKLDPLNKLTNSKLYCNRAVVCCKLGRVNEAVADCTMALELDETNLKALLRRAKCHMDLADYEEAVKDYEKVCKLDKSRDSKRLLQEAKTELKRSKRKDYYKILGIERNATEDEIKKAYRKRALDHHPDRHANATDFEKKEQEKKFKEVGEAYGVLLDPKKRSRYDNGQDMDEDMDASGFSGMDPSHLFNVFYGTDFGDGFSFQSGGGFPGFAFHHYN